MIQSSELILNPDGSVYHLNLKPEHIAHDIIVGDQNRVEKITQFFDSIEFSTQKRIQNPNRTVQRQEN
jgi:uridine phosphorylase